MDIPEGCEIDGTIFTRCPKDFVGDLAIPDGITFVGWRAFEKCRSLTGVYIPPSVIVIGAGAFCGCSSLTHIRIPESVTAIGMQAFYGCGHLKSVEVANSVASIGEHAFWSCGNLTSAILPKGCEIGKNVFPPSCEIFKGTVPEYRAYLAKNFAEAQAGEGVEIVGMHAPQTEPVIDSRGGRGI